MSDQNILLDETLNLSSEASKQAEETLKIRRTLELKLVQKFDRSEIDKRRECWYLVDSLWLNEWSSFVHSDGDPPGCMSSKGLIDVNNKPLTGLRNRIDYRGVIPLVFYIFVDLYGHDNSPQFTRYTIDIYAPPVPIDRLVDIQYRAQNDAAYRVQRIRSRWLKWQRDDEEEEKEEGIWCCGLTKQHLEAFIYWMIMCWARKKSGRKNIRYRSYKPLKTDESEHDYDSAIEDEDLQIARADKDHPRKSWILAYLRR